jgi:Phage integrase family.
MPLKLVRHPRRSKHFYLRGSVRGQNVFETTGTSERSAAEAIRIRRESELLDRSIFGPSETVTFAEAAVSYLSEGKEARFLPPISDKLARMKLKAINQDVADRTAAELYPNTAPATRKRQFYIPLCAVLNHAARRGWCARPMIKHPTVPEPTTTWSSPERFAKLLPHTKGQLRRFLVLSVYTGARLSEILRVNWDHDVSLPMRAIVLRKTKNGDMRTVHIPDPLLIELSGVPEKERRGRMFKWASKQCVYVPLRNACKRAGVDYMPPHQQGRHTYATWMRSFGGLDLVGLKQAGGWKNIQSVVRYAHVTPNEAGRAADKLPCVQSACSDEAEKKIRKAK